MPRSKAWAQARASRLPFSSLLRPPPSNTRPLWKLSNPLTAAIIAMLGHRAAGEGLRQDLAAEVGVVAGKDVHEVVQRRQFLGDAAFLARQLEAAQPVEAVEGIAQRPLRQILQRLIFGGDLRVAA